MNPDDPKTTNPQTTSPQATTAATPAAPKAKDKPAKGDVVALVTASGARIPMEVTAVHKNGATVDLVGEHGGVELVITASPFDETGRMPDSWHWPVK